METLEAPSIVVRTAVSADSHPAFDRWLDAAIDSLAAASRAALVSSWSIAIDSDPSGLLAPIAIAVAQKQARHSGGTLHYLGGEPQDAAALTLFVAADAILLSSTVVRLLRSPEAGVRPVVARELPLGGRSCLLMPAGKRGSLLDVGSDVNGDEFYSEEAAVVFRQRAIPGSGVAGGDVDAQSLLELMLPAPSLSTAREEVAQGLDLSKEPLLSVVLRTRGRRPEALRDALLCLAGQSDGRFEVVLVVHDANIQSVAAIVADQPEWLRSRTRVIPASGGTRARPLNVGIAAAVGTSIAFLDDDDVVLATWVEAFLAGAILSSRRVVRAVAGVQHVSSAKWNGGLEGHVVDAPVELPYPAIFDLADHLRVNQTPFMAFAFPTAFFVLFGGADETLEVCEDWDLILRAASTLGVVQVPTVTAIYRRWNSGGDSYTTHGSASWERDMLRVRAKLDARPIILPLGSASQLADLSALRSVPEELSAVYSSTSWRVSAPLRWLGQRFGRSGRMV